MSKLTDAGKRTITEELAKWMGCGYYPEYNLLVTLQDGTSREWYPFESLNDACMLLVECDRRGLMGSVVASFLGERMSPGGYVKLGLLATPEHITLAVWEVVEGLNKGRGD